MMIYQLVPSLAYGDAIGNEVIALHGVISDLGYETKVLADYIDPRVNINGDIYNDNSFTSQLNENDIVIYHKATGSYFSEKFKNLNCKKIMIYHNMTPSAFFSSFNKKIEKELEYGIRQLDNLKGKVEYILADSEFNKSDLEAMGFTCKIDVQPLIINFSDYDKEADENIINKYKDNGTNILFTGRIAPNKKQEDIIKVFYYYKNYVDKDAKLFLVGSYNGTEKYYAKLKGFVKQLNLKDVYFTAHIPFKEILAYYKIADVFLCMSEHEGFCVPLLEAMYFDIPIVAFNSTAIPYTLGNSGVIFDSKDYIEFSEAIRKIREDKSYRNEIISKQRENLSRFKESVTSELFKEYLNKYIKNI